MVCAEIENSWEIGSKHASMAQGRLVYGAGELKIDLNGQMTYDADSGTYNYPLCEWYHEAVSESACRENLKNKLQILLESFGA